MDEFLRWLAAWRGIEVENGAELQFEFANFPSGGLGMLVLMACALAILLIAFVYRRDGKNLHTWQRVVLATLRSLAVLAAIALLLEPNLVSVKHETRPGHVLLLVDNSQSMTHYDAWRREAVAADLDGWRRFGPADPATVPRFELVKELLAHGGGEVVRKLAAKNQVQLYEFASGLEPLPVVVPPAPPEGTPPPKVVEAPRVDTEALRADGRSTNLGGALRTALDRSRNAEIAAVVVVSDGRRNAGPQGAEVVRLLNQRKVPHTFVLGIGDPSETQMVALGKFETPEKVFQRDPFSIKASLVAQGYERVAVAVKLVREDAQGTKETVRSQQVEVGGDRTDVAVEWNDLTADTPGRYLYSIEVTPPNGEVAMAERHVRSSPIDVLGERLRLLLLAGTAGHEFQILRQLMMRDKTIDVSCWQQSADERYVQDGDPDVRIDHLPVTPEEMDVYDVVVLIDPNPEKLTAPFCKLLQEHVTDGGCGLWWVAGEKYSLDAMRQQATTYPLAELLPIVPDIQFAERKTIGFGIAFPRPWGWQLSPEGESGPGAKITRISANREESRLLWSRLPPHYFWFPVIRLKPVAIAIAEFTNPERKRGGSGMPMVAMQNVGAGRVLFTATDETYRWRSLYEDAYNRFWVNGVRYLFGGRIHAGDSRLRLEVSADKIGLGESLDITASAKDAQRQPLVVDRFAVQIERDGQQPETVQLEPVDGVPGSYLAHWRPTQLGNFRVRPAEAAGKNVEAAFQVVAAQFEQQGPMDRAELMAIAQASGGEFFAEPNAFLAALDRIPSRSATDTFRTPHAVWDGWPTIVFLLVVLSLEWLLRKRFNLL